MDIIKAKFVVDFIDIIDNMYRLGWDERNGGNVSYLIDDKDVKKYLFNKKFKKTYSLNGDFTYLIGKYFLVTGTGKYFKNVKKHPLDNIGIIKIIDKNEYAIIWGFNDNAKPTSELPSHLLSHIERLKVSPNHHVIIHAHPTNIVAMTFVHELSDKEFSNTLWKMSTECIIVFPNGIGVLPWMVCGNELIGKETAMKMKEYNLVIWAFHGIFGAGDSIDEAFGLIETAEKAAQIYLKVYKMPIIQSITDNNLRELAKNFHVFPKESFLK